MLSCFQRIHSRCYNLKTTSRKCDCPTAWKVLDSWTEDSLLVALLRNLGASNSSSHLRFVTRPSSVTPTPILNHLQCQFRPLNTTTTLSTNVHFVDSEQSEQSSRLLGLLKSYTETSQSRNGAAPILCAMDVEGVNLGRLGTPAWVPSN